VLELDDKANLVSAIARVIGLSLLNEHR